LEAEEFKNLLCRYETNEVTAAEKLMLDNWYAAYETESFDGFTDADHAKRIKAEMKSVIMAKLPAKNVRLKLWRKTYTYAAILALLIPAVLIFINRFKTVYTKAGEAGYTVFTTSAKESKILTLQDNSIVHLNPSSTLKLSSLFGTLPQRDVFLEKGNAFFEVAKDKHHPFIVHAKQLTTRVLGTKFRVSNGADHITEVNVSEGKVEVSNHQKVLAVLLPGKKIRYNQKTDQWIKSDFGIAENNAWYKSAIDFNQATFDEVANAVKINYGVELKSAHPNTINYRYNLQIRSERSLDQTIRMICSVHKNNYRRTKNGIVIY